MQQSNRREFIQTALATSALSVLSPSLALTQTTHGRVISGFPAGSTVDTLSRLIANKLSAAGQPFIVENRVGAAGRIAAEQTKSMAPDGQSVLITPDAIMTLYPFVYKNLPYDPMRDFRPVAVFATAPHTVAVGPVVPDNVRDLRNFVKWCKDNPQKAAFATSGPGSPLHFIGVMLGRSAGIELTHVSYRGGLLAAQDVAGGQLASCVTVLSDVLQLVRSGQLRLLAVTGKERSRFVPEVPTATESGFPELESFSWYGVFAPAKLPDARAKKLYEAVAATMRDPAVVETVTKIGLEPAQGAQEEAMTLLRRDSERWAQIVKQVGYVATE